MPPRRSRSPKPDDRTLLNLLDARGSIQLSQIGELIADHERAPGWFWHLPPALLANLDQLATWTTVPRQSTLFSEGQKAESVYVICQGRIKVTRGSRHGRVFLLKMAEPGEILGLSAALSATPYEVTAQITEDAALLRFTRKDFVDFIHSHVECSLSAAESLNDEYRATLEEACRLALYNSVPSRLAHLLIALALENGTAGQREPRFPMPLTHEEIGTMLGASRESITRILNDFRSKGILSIRGSEVTIRRKSALELLL